MEVEVWVFFAKGRRQGTVLRRVREVCAENRWQLQARPTAKVTARFGRVPLVNANDAKDVYQRMHRRKVAVLSVQEPGTNGPFIRKRPNEAYCLRNNKVVSLREYCRHKAFFRRLFEGSEHPTRWVGAFEYWANRIYCDGQMDPRCLPLHVFPTRRGTPRRLLTQAGRDEFAREHDESNGRKDGANNHWEVAKDGHGRQDNLVVAGAVLRKGFHWHVKRQVGEVRLYTPVVEWLIRDYLNVYADAILRGREPYAVKKG